MIAIGMMSGTSLDGVDACLLDIKDNFEIKILNTHTLEYPEEIREKLLLAANNHASTEDICLLNFIVGEVFAQCANELVEKSLIKPFEISFISSHGQTVFHIPEDKEIGGIKTKSTLQIGDISVISEKTGIICIGDFRTKDMAAGGLGAPLVPFADEIIFKREKSRAVQNIGGIANVTVLSPNCPTFAFDTGPGNMLIDYFSKKLFDTPFDKDGNFALQGRVNQEWLDELLLDSYYYKEPPKTTGRELFNDCYAEKIFETAPPEKSDVMATITALTAHTIFNAYQKFVFPKTDIEEIIIGGGGAYNKFLSEYLEKLFGKIPIKTHEDYGIPDKFKEAIAFAIIGYCTYKNIPNNIPNCTGASKPVVMGKISY